MTLTCIVVGCGSAAQRDKVSFFKVPAILQFKHQLKKNKLSKTRREMWLKAIKRDDLTVSKINTQRVCSRHFITGKMLLSNGVSIYLRLTCLCCKVKLRLWKMLITRTGFQLSTWVINRESSGQPQHI